MDTGKAALSLLALTVIASGCINGGGDTSVEGEGAITVTELSVNPAEVYSGTSVRATLEAYNTGNLRGSVHTGSEGRNMLKNFCPDIFSMDEQSYAVTTSRTNNAEKESYVLGPGERIRVQWKLDQEGNVPLYGLNCDLRFELPFDYSVSAYRQIQVKQDRETEGSSNLQSESSSGPMLFSVQTVPGSTGQPDTFVPTDQDITVSMQLINTQSTDSYTKGLVRADKESLEISASDPLVLDEAFQESSPGTEDPDTMVISDGTPDGKTLYWASQTDEYSEPRCEVPNGEITMYEGKSATISCDVPVPEEEDIAISEISEISASINYTYVKDAGTRNVQVNARE